MAEQEYVPDAETLACGLTHCQGYTKEEAQALVSKFVGGVQLEVTRSLCSQLPKSALGVGVVLDAEGKVLYDFGSPEHTHAEEQIATSHFAAVARAGTEGSAPTGRVTVAWVRSDMTAYGYELVRVAGYAIERVFVPARDYPVEEDGTVDIEKVSALAVSRLIRNAEVEYARDVDALVALPVGSKVIDARGDYFETKGRPEEECDTSVAVDNRCDSAWPDDIGFPVRVVWKPVS